MKIKQLKIHNIASIIDETIDFTAEPLSSSDVFLICGEIGSGKSSILDSICLALFNTTPRLYGNSVDTLETNKDCLAMNDPRQLMRRNTGEAYARLTFTGIDNKEYEAEWYVQRGKQKKPEQEMSNQTWKLTNLSDGTSVSGTGNTDKKTKDVRNAIADAIGLNFEQFCRTTMLAQGEFTKFLVSDEKEKASILEKITHFDEYTRIGQRLHVLYKQKEKAYNDAKAKAGDTGMSPEEQKELEGKIQKQEEELKGINEEIELITKKINWLIDEGTLGKEQKKAEDKLSDAQKATEAPSFLSQKKAVEEWEATADIRKQLDKRNTADEASDKAEKQIEKCRTEYRTLLCGLLFAEKELERNKNNQKPLESLIEEHTSDAKRYEHAGEIKTQLENIAGWRRDISGSNDDIAKKERELNDTLNGAFEVAEKNLEEAKKAYEEHENAIKAKDDELRDANLPKLNQDQLDANAGKTNIETAQRLLREWTEAEKTYNNATTELAQRKDELDRKESELEKLKEKLKDAENQKKSTADHYQKMKDQSDHANALKAMLHPGEECPVCGHKIEHELIAIIDKSLQDAESEMNEASREYDRIKGNFDTQSATYETEKGNYERDKKKHDADTSVSQKRNELLDACKKIDISEIDDALATKLEDKLKASGEHIFELADKIRKANKLADGIREERDKLGEEKKKLDGLQVAYDKAKENKEAAGKAIETAEKAIEQYKESIQKAEQVREVRVAKAEWDDNPKEYAEKLAEEAKAYSDAVDKLGKLQYSYNQLLSDIRKANDAKKEITELIADWAEISAEKEEEDKNLQTNFATLAANAKSACDDKKTASHHRKSAQDVLDRYLDNNSELSIGRLEELNSMKADEISTWRGSINDIENALTAAGTELENVNDRIEKHNGDKPKFAEGDTLEALTNQKGAKESAKSVIDRSIGADQQILLDDQKKKEAAQDAQIEADKALKEYNRWNALYSLIGDKEGSKFQRIAQSFILESLLEKANYFLQNKKLCQRYTLHAVPGKLYIKVEDANQGFATRGSDSLSGGEKFLVSLALALALAEIADNLKVDTLFIDEGFGTLSGEPLTNAIRALSTLHTTSGRHVGIISHLDEVRENIPVRLQLVPGAEDASSCIKIEGGK